MRDNLIPGIILVILVIFLLSIFALSFKFPDVTGNAVTGRVIAGGALEGLELSVTVPEKYQKVQAERCCSFKLH